MTQLFALMYYDNVIVINISLRACRINAKCQADAMLTNQLTCKFILAYQRSPYDVP